MGLWKRIFGGGASDTNDSKFFLMKLDPDEKYQGTHEWLIKRVN